MKAKAVNHSSRAHAILSASGSARWINCTPSARLEEQYGERSDTAFTREGTVAHELAELFLRSDLGLIADSAVHEAQLGTIMDNALFCDEMLDMVSVYSDYCRAQYIEAMERSGGKAYAEIEQKLDLTSYIPDSFGTADFVVVSPDVLEVIDLKYGKGVAVKADWNSQLMVYALGALEAAELFCTPETVRMTIVQPRLDSISTFELPTQELLDWAENVLKPAAKAAYEGEGNLSTGAWCKFCSVKMRCRALYQEQLELAKTEFKSPHLLTDDEIAAVLKSIPLMETWLKAVKEYATSQAINDGKQWAGFKLVEGRSQRKWANPEATAKMLLAAFPELSEDQIYKSDLATLTEIEKLVGNKRFASVEGLVIKPAGAPTLVPESDKRPAIGLEQAKLDFENV